MFKYFLRLNRINFVNHSYNGNEQMAMCSMLMEFHSLSNKSFNRIKIKLVFGLAKYRLAFYMMLIHNHMHVKFFELLCRFLKLLCKYCLLKSLWNAHMGKQAAWFECVSKDITYNTYAYGVKFRSQCLKFYYNLKIIWFPFQAFC